MRLFRSAAMGLALAVVVFASVSLRSPVPVAAAPCPGPTFSGATETVTFCFTGAAQTWTVPARRPFRDVLGVRSPGRGYGNQGTAHLGAWAEGPSRPGPSPRAPRSPSSSVGRASRRQIRWLPVGAAAGGAGGFNGGAVPEATGGGGDCGGSGGGGASDWTSWGYEPRGKSLSASLTGPRPSGTFADRALRRGAIADDAVRTAIEGREMRKIRSVAMAFPLAVLVFASIGVLAPLSVAAAPCATSTVAGVTTLTFCNTGAQNWTVPVGVHSATFTTIGAVGGAGTGGLADAGAGRQGCRDCGRTRGPRSRSVGGLGITSDNGDGCKSPEVPAASTEAPLEAPAAVEGPVGERWRRRQRRQDRR